MRDVERELLEFVDELREARELHAAVRVVTMGVVRLLGVEHASLRLLDDARTRLLLASRTGRPYATGNDTPFVVGEGLIGWIVANGRALRVGDAPRDPRFAARAGSRPLVSFLGVPLSDDRGCFGVLATSSLQQDVFSERDEVRLALLAALASGPLGAHRLRRLAETDPLTGLLNRHALDHALPELAEGDALVMLDVDHFKDVNDRHGHAEGDRVLAELGAALRDGVRMEDSAVRYGGEEFLVVLPHVSDATALETAERLRARVAERVKVAGTPISLSAGVATRSPGERRDALLARVDRALYAAKNAGRDRSVLAPP